MSEKIKTKNIKFIGVDNSIHMIERTRKRLKANDCRHRYELKQWDLNNELFLRNPSVVILVLTLQFIRPIRREVLIRQIYEKLSKNGCVIIVEKILSKDSVTNGLFRDFHFDYKKRRGYSELEIAQKREALENILIPYTLDENILLLRRNGFPIVETFFKWYNFAGLVAVKQ
jgi:tRNA (cmo5U34)-methyltransferase